MTWAKQTWVKIDVGKKAVGKKDVGKTGVGKNSVGKIPPTAGPTHRQYRVKWIDISKKNFQGPP